MGSLHLWFILFEVGLYSTFVLAATPILTISSPTDHLRQGSTVILTCTVINLDSEYFSEGGSIKIVRRNTGEDYQYLATWTPSYSNVSDPKFQVSGYRNPDRIVVEFQIEGVTTTDASSYQCAVFDSIAWEYGSNRHPLEMMRPPSSKFPECAVSWQGDNDRDLKLDCYAERSVPPPKLVWYRNGAEISDAVVFRDYQYYENVITLTNVSSIDGNYVCRFYYSDGDIVDQRSCRVHKPFLTMFPAKPSFILGGSTKFSVFVQAGPALRKSLSCRRRFTVDEEQLEENLDITLQGNDRGEVFIRHIEENWNGSEIICAAENMVGASSKAFTVIVENHDEMDKADVYILPQDPVIVEGEEVSFVCVRPHFLKDFPISWYFAGRQISKTNRNDRYILNNDGQTLTLTSTTLSDDVQIVSCQSHLDNGVTLEASSDLRISPRAECLNSRNESCLLEPQTLPDHFHFYWKEHTVLLLFFLILSILGVIFLVVIFVKCLACMWRKKYPHIEGFPNAKGRIDSTSSKKYLLTEEGMLFGPSAMQASIAADRPTSVLTMNRSLPEVPAMKMNSLHRKQELRPPTVQPHEVSYVDMHRNEEGPIPPPSYYSATLPTPEKIPPEHVTELNKFPPARKRVRHPSGRTPQDDQFSEQEGDDVFCDPYQELEDLYRERAESNAYTGKK